MRRQFFRQCLGKSIDCEVGCVIGRSVRRTLLARGGRQIDNCATVGITSEHVSGHSLGAQERPDDLDVQNSSEKILVQVDDRHPVLAASESSVIDQDVDLAELV